MLISEAQLMVLNSFEDVIYDLHFNSLEVLATPHKPMPANEPFQLLALAVFIIARLYTT
jgi:hypothetical protein